MGERQKLDRGYALGGGARKENTFPQVRGRGGSNYVRGEKGRPGVFPHIFIKGTLR